MGSTAQSLSEADEQRRRNRRVLHMLGLLPRRQQNVANAFTGPSPAPRAEAKVKRRGFEAWCREDDYTGAAEPPGPVCGLM